ncbi:MAG: hypothetical protein C5B59_05820 [Bacteroidetes bacterium]|nr:MAG: hypothetical protein C5B59_05820 [Bacteroidota bacterium]
MRSAIDSLDQSFSLECCHRDKSAKVQPTTYSIEQLQNNLDLGGVACSADETVFPDEGHGFSEKENQNTTAKKTLAFLDKYVKTDTVNQKK